MRPYTLQFALLASCASVAATPGVQAGETLAPQFVRPVDGVPIGEDGGFIRTVPQELFDASDDHLRNLQVGVPFTPKPANLPSRFFETETTISTTNMPIGMGSFGQFVDHDITSSKQVNDLDLVPPFVKALGLVDGNYVNLRTPGFDLDSVYRISPFEFPSDESITGPWDEHNLRFHLLRTPSGAYDFYRTFEGGLAIIGDGRNDEQGIIAHVHRAFMQLHNSAIDRILEREQIDETTLEVGDPTWTLVYNEARNYVTAYYQGIIANEFVPMLTGRTLFEALEDDVHPVGPIDEPQVSLEFAQCGFRLHTIMTEHVQIGENTWVSPISPALRNRVSWSYLFGPDAPRAGKIDTALPETLRTIFELFIPGNPIEITLDLAQVNLLRGREVGLPSGEEYLAFMLDEMGLESESTSVIRGKQVLDAEAAAAILNPRADADLLADLTNGDTDIWAYVMLEADLNDGVLGPVGQDIVERNFLGVLLADDWSIFGANADQFTPEQMEFFRTATFERLLDEIIAPADLNRDNFVDTIDMLILFADWGQSDSVADLNDDGTVDVIDMLELFNSWAP